MPTENEIALVDLITKMIKTNPADSMVYLLKAVLTQCGGEVRIDYKVLRDVFGAKTTFSFQPDDSQQVFAVSLK